MRLANKHTNVQNVRYADFSGGLNTTDAVENIANNELSQAVNVEIYKGQLKTVAGDKAVYKDTSVTFDSIIYDSIESKTLLVDTSHKVYLLEDSKLTEKGTLTGTSEMQYAAWEDGVLIASGGKLQYYHGGTLETVTNSPDVSRGVFIKQGRVWTFYDDVLKCSGVGDETNWTQKSDDNSSSQFLQIGYKDGGKIVGVSSLSSDTLIFKDNHHAYRLSGTYPNWSLAEIGRQIDCKSYHACIALADTTGVLGKTRMQVITTTTAYGDMMATDIGQKIYQDIEKLPASVRLRFIPGLNQVWLIDGTGSFLFYDANVNGCFKRRYNSNIVDAVEASGSIYLLKQHGIYVLDESIQDDDGSEMLWKFQIKTLTSNHDILLKHVYADTTPIHTNYADEYFRAGDVVVGIRQPNSANWIYKSSEAVYLSTRSVAMTPSKAIFTNSEDVRFNFEEIYESSMPLVSQDVLRSGTRCVDHEKSIAAMMWGRGGVTVFNSLSYDIVEV